MRVLVTGGAGYIGAHTVKQLQARGDDVFVIDDLVTGDAQKLSNTELLQLDISDSSSIDVMTQFLIENNIDSVIHFAARKRVDESIARPAWYYKQNVGGLANLLLAMESARVSRLIFSSSAAVYGEIDGKVHESQECKPINPYGETKLVGELLVEAMTKCSDLKACSLRYFNVAGSASRDLMDTQKLNLIPIVIDHLENSSAPLIFGDDYPTSDGTCVRDYVHVTDVASAHLAALDAISTFNGYEFFNVGTGSGTSVREIVELVSKNFRNPATPIILPRREGDPAEVVASVRKIESELGWKAQYGLLDILSSVIPPI